MRSAVSAPSPVFPRSLRGTQPPSIIRVSEVISALSFALDLTEGQPMGHSVRSCVIGMHLADEMGLPLESRADLYYALLMKDAGCSSNSSRLAAILGSDDIGAKRDLKTTDWSRMGWDACQYALAHTMPNAPFLERVRTVLKLATQRQRNSRDLVQVRCERGASIARRIGLSAATAEAIFSLDELWNGKGHPRGLRGTQIPLLSRILNIAQTIDVFTDTHGAAAALDVTRARSGTWFDPDLVKAFQSIAKKVPFWLDIECANQRVLEMEPASKVWEATEETIDSICVAFADVIDAKSPFTYRHSTGVSAVAVALAGHLGLAEHDRTLLRRAALLHDVGKLSVSNSILDKPDRLTPEEWGKVRLHPRYSFEILRRIPGFHELAELAATHHEKLDGSGYFRGYSAGQMSLPARILVVADIYDALAAKRPYRDALPPEKVLEIMGRDAPRALDEDCFTALKSCACGLAAEKARIQ